ncbi:MAG: methyltransferase domain-containing protein [Gammaproteobacteria bacterium]|nr:methyltransferase domain-containing protein [Gammaproteobacteria bacterium]
MDPKDLLIRMSDSEFVNVGGFTFPVEDFSISDFMQYSLGMTWLHPGGIYSTERLLKLLPIQKESKVLDIGCGLGSTTRHIFKKFKCSVTGVDKNPQMIDGARDLTSSSASMPIEFITADAANTGLPDNSFDIIVIQSVLCFNNKTDILREAYRVLKPGGTIGLNEVTWTKPPSEAVKKVTRSTICETFKGALQENEWEKVLHDSHFVNIISKPQPFEATAPYQMLREEGFFNTIRIFARVLTNPDTNMRLKAVSSYIKNYPGHFGYGLYIAKKPE